MPSLFTSWSAWVWLWTYSMLLRCFYFPQTHQTNCSEVPYNMPSVLPTVPTAMHAATHLLRHRCSLLKVKFVLLQFSLFFLFLFTELLQSFLLLLPCLTFFHVLLLLASSSLLLCLLPCFLIALLCKVFKFGTNVRWLGRSLWKKLSFSWKEQVSRWINFKPLKGIIKFLHKYHLRVSRTIKL